MKIRVGEDHPLADPNGYAYEHLLVWISAGHPRPDEGELIHHRNEDKTDNRLQNLTLVHRVEHSKTHQSAVPDSTVRRIRERYAAGEDGTALASEYGLPHSRVYRYVKGESRLSAGGPIAPAGSLRGRRRRP